MLEKTRLNTKEAAEYLTLNGIQTTEKTLAKYRSKGGGCPYRKIRGKRVVYEKADLNNYIEEILSEKVNDTFEFKRIGGGHDK